MLLTILLQAKGQKKLHFELGLNYPISIEQYGGKESHIGGLLDGIYNINKNTNIDVCINYESYTSILKKENLKFINNGRSLSLIPGVNYILDLKEDALKPYFGIGIGASFDNTDTGIFNEGMKCHVVFSPKIGLQAVKHIDIFARYNITHKNFNRFIIGVGYIF